MCFHVHQADLSTPVRKVSTIGNLLKATYSCHGLLRQSGRLHKSDAQQRHAIYLARHRADKHVITGALILKTCTGATRRSGRQGQITCTAAHRAATLWRNRLSTKYGTRFPIHAERFLDYEKIWFEHLSVFPGTSRQLS